MLTDLNTSVTELSSEQVDQLFGTTSTPTETTPPSNVKTEIKDGELYVKNPGSDIPYLDAAALEDLEKGTTEEETKEETSTETTETTEPAKEEDKKPEAEATKEEDSAEVQAARSELLKSNVEYLIQKGIFKDFEGREELELTDEVYAELLEAQVNSIIDEKYNGKKKLAGEYGEAILDYLEKGGDGDQILDLFKERKVIDDFDVSTEDSQKELVSKYYKEVLGWKPERIKRVINNLATEEGALEAEAGDVKEKYDSHYKAQVEELSRQQQEFVAQQQARQQEFNDSIKAAIKEYDIDENARLQLEKSLLKKKELADGTKVSELDLKFVEWQRDPKKFVELAEFILDRDKYLKRRDVKLTSNAVDKTFKFIKGNAAISKNTGSKHTEPEERSKQQGTNFSFVTKK